MNDDDDKYLDPKQNPMIRIEDENGYSVPVDLIGPAIQGLVKDEPNFEITIRPGFTITGNQGSDPVVQRDGHSCKLNEVSSEVESEILDAIRKHKKTIKSLQQSKYLDPDRNPIIRFDTDED